MPTWQVDNIKCGGCAGTIRRALTAIDGVSAVTVDVEQGSVSFVAEEIRWPQVSAKLSALGYPPSGSLSGLSAVGASARSVVSCAIGKLHGDDSDR